MKNLNTPYYVWTLVFISSLVYTIYFFIFINPIESKGFFDFLKPLPIVVAIDTIVIAVFVKWLLKWEKLYPWFVPFPNLNGTWKGRLKSNWICPNTGETPDDIPVMLTIHQTFTHIGCTMRTGEMCSESFSSEIVINSENNISKLVYSYESAPDANVTHRSAPHCGTALLKIVNNKTELSGSYWTSRETIGTINLRFWKKEKVDVYNDKFGIHPMFKK